MLNNNSTMSLSVRFAKEAYINIDVPISIINDANKVKDFCDNYIKNMKDSDIVQSFADGEDMYVEKDNIEVTMIENPNQGHFGIYESPVHKVLMDGNYLEKIENENIKLKNMLKELGYDLADEIESGARPIEEVLADIKKTDSVAKIKEKTLSL